MLGKKESKENDRNSLAKLPATKSGILSIIIIKNTV